MAYETRNSTWLLALAAALYAGAAFPGGRTVDMARAGDAGLATGWVRGHNSQVRLIAGPLVGAGGVRQLYAGAEIVIGDGWKTYWRSPGDDAGVPPHFDFSGSSNLARADVRFPAPFRFKTPGGDSLGYKHAVTFPIALTAKDAAKPIALKLKMEFGVCREICIPAAAGMALEIPPLAALTGNDGAIAAAVAAVPREAAKRKPADPVLKAGAAELSGPKPRLIFEADYPGGLAGADLFVEGPDGSFVPQPQRQSTAAGNGNRLRFVIDLTKGADIKELTGQPLRLTLVSDAGQSQAIWLMK